MLLISSLCKSLSITRVYEISYINKPVLEYDGHLVMRTQKGTWTSRKDLITCCTDTHIPQTSAILNKIPEVVSVRLYCISKACMCVCVCSFHFFVLALLSRVRVLKYSLQPQVKNIVCSTEEKESNKINKIASWTLHLDSASSLCMSLCAGEI